MPNKVTSVFVLIPVFIVHCSMLYIPVLTDVFWPGLAWSMQMVGVVWHWLTYQLVNYVLKTTRCLNAGGFQSPRCTICCLRISSLHFEYEEEEKS